MSQLQMTHLSGCHTHSRTTFMEIWSFINFYSSTATKQALKSTIGSPNCAKFTTFCCEQQSGSMTTKLAPAPFQSISGNGLFSFASNALKAQFQPSDRRPRVNAWYVVRCDVHLPSVFVVILASRSPFSTIRLQFDSSFKDLQPRSHCSAIG